MKIFHTDPRTVQRRSNFYKESSTLWHERHLVCTKKMSMHVCVYALSCTLSSMSGYIHTHATFKHTHSAMMCVCFTFSISGCCCFVAVLGAAAHTVEAEEEGEVLDRHRCLLALAALRHAKWFQVGTHSLPVFVPDAYCSLTIHPGRIYLLPAHFSVLIIVTQFNRRRHLHFISTNLYLFVITN